MHPCCCTQQPQIIDNVVVIPNLHVLRSPGTGTDLNGPSLEELVALSAAHGGRSYEEDIATWVYNPDNGVGMAIRKESEVDGERSPHVLSPGDVFSVSEERMRDGVLFLKLSDGRGWIFDRAPDNGVMCERHGPAPVERVEPPILEEDQTFSFDRPQPQWDEKEPAEVHADEQKLPQEQELPKDRDATSAPSAQENRQLAPDYAAKQMPKDETRANVASAASIDLAAHHKMEKSSKECLGIGLPFLLVLCLLRVVLLLTADG